MPSAVHVVGTQPLPASLVLIPQTPGTPPAPQLWGAVQFPHWIRPPQPSPMGPQLTCWAAHVVGVHDVLPPHWLGVPPAPQLCGGVQLPHWTMPPQPSLTGPHVAFQSAHVFGVQLLLPPQVFALPPPPHVWGALQAPHWIRFPQPSPCGPHVAPISAQVSGTQRLKPASPVGASKEKPPLDESVTVPSPTSDPSPRWPPSPPELDVALSNSLPPPPPPAPPDEPQETTMSMQSPRVRGNATSARGDFIGDDVSGAKDSPASRCTIFARRASLAIERRSCR
jgi:hypothetical protein